MSRARIIGGLNTYVEYTDAVHGLAINQSSYSVAVSFGSRPHPRRRIFAGIFVGTASGVQPSTVSIGGVSATKHIGIAPAGVFSTSVQIWSALVPTGTSGNVDISGLTSGDMDGGSVYAWAGYDLASATARDTKSVAGSSSPSDLSLTCPSRGFVLAVGAISNTLVATWSCSPLTINSNDVTPNPQSFGAMVSKSAGGSPLSITAQYTNSGGGPFGPTAVAASFK